MNVMVSFNDVKLNGKPVRTPEQIALDLLEAKKAENAANARRVALEEELIGMLGMKDEGSKTHNIDGFKVVITTAMSRKLDWDMYDAVAERIPVDLRPVKPKRELDVTGVKYLKNNEPDIYAMIAPALTVKPNKPTVIVTRTE